MRQESLGNAYEVIRLERSDGVATITLHRPERLNAFTEQMLEEFVDALDQTDADDETRAVVVTGSGRAFCAGSDLGADGSAAPIGDDAFSMEEHPDGGGILARRIFDSAKPVIAAVNGPAVGIGATMTLPMDARLASSDSRFGFVFVKRGLVPEAASSFFLPRIVGISRAAEWVLTGRVFGADEALAGGLVRSVHPPAELVPAARSLAMEMAHGNSQVAVALSRRMLWQMLAYGDPVTAHRADSEALHFLMPSADLREGVAAFLEKREPAFPLRVSSDMPSFFARWQSERGGLAPPTSLRRNHDRLRKAR